MQNVQVSTKQNAWFYYGCSYRNVFCGLTGSRNNDFITFTKN